MSCCEVKTDRFHRKNRMLTTFPCSKTTSTTEKKITETWSWADNVSENENSKHTQPINRTDTEKTSRIQQQSGSLFILFFKSLDLLQCSSLSWASSFRVRKMTWNTRVIFSYCQSIPTLRFVSSFDPLTNKRTFVMIFFHATLGLSTQEEEHKDISRETLRDLPKEIMSQMFSSWSEIERSFDNDSHNIDRLERLFHSKEISEEYNWQVNPRFKDTWSTW